MESHLLPPPLYLSAFPHTHPAAEAASTAVQPHSLSFELWDIKIGTSLAQVLVHALGHSRREILPPEHLAKSEAFSN